MFGCDPEFFIVNRKTGAPVPAHKFFPDKHSPVPLTYGAVFRDGFAVEINVEPTDCRGTFLNSMKKVIEQVKVRIGAEHKLVVRSTMKITPDLLQGAPDDVLMFGCDPSLNAWGDAGLKGKLSVDPATHMKRYAGGHIHLSNYFEHAAKKAPRVNDRYASGLLVSEKDYDAYIRTLDYYVGLPLTYIFEAPTIFARRKLYGRAGEYRVQPHGLEYRVPGPEWTRHQAVGSLAIGIMRTIANQWQVGAHRKILDKIPGAQVRAAINTGAKLASTMKEVGGLTNYYDYDILSAVKKDYEAHKWGLEKTLADMQKNHADAHWAWPEYLRDIGLAPPRS